MKELFIEDVTNPSHYKAFGFESMDMMRALFDFNMKDIYAFNFLKYCLRYEFKNGLEDLDKARWYLKALIEFFKNAEHEASYQRSKAKGAASRLSENVYKGLETRNILDKIKDYIFQIELKNPPLAEILADFIELYFNRLEQNALYYAGFEARFELFYRSVSITIEIKQDIEKYRQELFKENQKVEK